MGVIAMEAASDANTARIQASGEANPALMSAVLRFVRQQMPLLATYIEEQALVIVTEFKALAEKTQQHSEHLNEVIEVASNIEMGGKSVPYEHTIEVLYEPLAEAIEKILDVSKLSMTMVMNIGNAADNITRMENSIAQVQDLTKQTNMLAMNTQIEAARTGEVGKSFRIIAQEVKALSERIKIVSSDIKKEVSCVAGSVRRSSKLVDSLAYYDMTDNLQLRDSVGELIESILAQNKHFSELLEAAAVSSRETASSINNLIVGIQFQDRSSQITGDLCGLLDYVIDGLERSASAARAQLPEDEMRTIVDGIKLSDVRHQLLSELTKQGLLARDADLQPKASEIERVAAHAVSIEDYIELF